MLDESGGTGAIEVRELRLDAPPSSGPGRGGLGAGREAFLDQAGDTGLAAAGQRRLLCRHGAFTHEEANCRYHCHHQQANHQHIGQTFAKAQV